jgi:PhnB protein
MTVSYIPPGKRTATPHLIIRGAGKAIEFYKKAFGAEELGRMPGPDGQTLMHAEIKIGDSHIFLADEFGEGGVCASPTKLGGTSIVMHLYVKDADAAFNQAVAAGAKVVMPLMNMFWGDRYGQVVDPFGHQWSIATHVEDVPPEEMGKRAAEAMKHMGSGKGC